MAGGGNVTFVTDIRQVVRRHDALADVYYCDVAHHRHRCRRQQRPVETRCRIGVMSVCAGRSPAGSGAFLEARQNRKRTVACRDLGPPVCRIGDSPLPGLPVPSIRFNIEVDWPNMALLRYFTGSAKLAWFATLKASRRT